MTYSYVCMFLTAPSNFLPHAYNLCETIYTYAIYAAVTSVCLLAQYLCRGEVDTFSGGHHLIVDMLYVYKNSILSKTN